MSAGEQSNSTIKSRFANNFARHISELAEEFRRRLKLISLERGHQGLKMSFSQVLIHLPPQGIRIADLARINGVSKQAMGKLVKEIEQLGYIERADDPNDQRAKRIILTATGRELIQDASQAIADVDQQFTQLIGSQALAELQQLAVDLFRSLRLQVPGVSQQPFTLPADHSQWGMLLTAIANENNQRLIEACRAQGHTDLKTSFDQILPHLTHSSVRIIDLAKRNDVSKQAMGKLVDEVEQLGYVQRVADPNDRRASILNFTNKGWALIADSVEALESLEAEYAERLGPVPFQRLCHHLAILHQQLQLGSNSQPPAPPWACLIEAIATQMAEPINGNQIPMTGHQAFLDQCHQWAQPGPSLQQWLQTEEAQQQLQRLQHWLQNQMDLP